MADIETYPAYRGTFPISPFVSGRRGANVVRYSDEIYIDSGVVYPHPCRSIVVSERDSVAIPTTAFQFSSSSSVRLRHRSCVSARLLARTFALLVNLSYMWASKCAWLRMKISAGTIYPGWSSCTPHLHCIALTVYWKTAVRIHVAY